MTGSTPAGGAARRAHAAVDALTCAHHAELAVAVLILALRPHMLSRVCPPGPARLPIPVQRTRDRELRRRARQRVLPPVAPAGIRTPPVPVARTPYSGGTP